MTGSMPWAVHALAWEAAADVPNIQIWARSVNTGTGAESCQIGGHPRGLSLVAVTAWGCLLGRCREFRRCPRSADLREAHGRLIRGRRRVHGACYAGCVPEHPECAGRYGWGSHTAVDSTGESGAEVLLPGVWGDVRACTWLSAGSAAREPAGTYI